MIEKEKESPKKGDFIDLEKSDFKKKNNFLSKFFVFLFFGIFFITLGFFLGNFLEKSEIVGSDSYVESLIQFNNDEDKEKKEQPFIQVEKINDLFEESNLIIKDSQKEIEKLKIRFTEIEQTLLKINQFSSTNIYDQDTRKYSILLNFLVLKKKFYNREEFEDELNRISLMFINNKKINDLISFFRTLDIKNLKKKNDLLVHLNEEINFFEEDFENFFFRLEREVNLMNKNVFESRETFINYLKEIFNSTFKVTKFEDNTLNLNDNINNESFRKILLLSKEYLLIGDLRKSIQTLRTSKLELDSDFRELLDESELILNSNEKLENLETEIYRAIGNDFD